MRRLSIAAVVIVTLFAVSAQAQRGMSGGRGGGAVMGGRTAGPSMGARSGPVMGGRAAGPVMSGRVAGPVMRGRSVGPVVGVRGTGGRFVAPARVNSRFVSGRSVVARPGVTSRRVVVAGGFGTNHFHPFGTTCFGFRCNPFFFHNRFFFNPFFFNAGFGFGLGVPFYPYSYIPGFDSGYYSPPPEQQPAVESDNGNGNDVQLAAQMQRLGDEMESMREEQRQANAGRASGASLSAREPQPTTFVFRDGSRISVPNYAIAGDTLWVVTEHSARKVSLADLDVAATEQANATNGIEIHLHVPDSLER